MISEFIRLQMLKGFRSVSFSRNLAGGLFLGFILILLLGSLLTIAFALEAILENMLKTDNIITVLNTYLLYFFLVELLYRFFLQKLPVFEMEKFLHLPVKRSQIVHFLLARSFISPLSLMVPICFGPFTLMEVNEVYGAWSAASWFGTIMLISGTIHWAVLWYKQNFGDHPVGILLYLMATFFAFGTHYFGYVNTGELVAPFFDWALSSMWPPVLVMPAFVLGYLGTFNYFRKHAYVEELGMKSRLGFTGRSSIDFFSRFGLAGEMANLEWKLILRHKKSRSYLVITLLFLLYGLFFYSDPAYTQEQGFSYFYIFLGAFITGVFIMQYGQLYLSWNSAGFDFYLSRKDGIEALVKGKYLLFLAISSLCFILSIPYVYFGWDVLLVHFAAFLFNMGVSLHVIVYIALWKPKPMSLDKGAVFNYEGVGIAQFLMGIPIIVLPYLVFIPSALLMGDYFGLIMLGTVGLCGLIFHDRLTSICVNKLIRDKYLISSTFRQEI